MYFTTEDYRKIESWLQARTVKDTDFKRVSSLDNDDLVPIIQDDENKIVTMSNFIKYVAYSGISDYFNVTRFTQEGKLNLKRAINTIPLNFRKLGLTITFHDEECRWRVYQFIGTSIKQWSEESLWKDATEIAIHNFIYKPDEEDITSYSNDEGLFMKLKDKEYDPSNFSGKGRCILRKNIIGASIPSEDGEDSYINHLTQEMIEQENTIYIIQYDYDLDSKVIVIPDGSILIFQGGSINNGTLFLKNTPVFGITSLSDMGNASIYGGVAPGQIFPFESNNTIILKWWNGKEWISIQETYNPPIVIDDAVKLIEVNGEEITPNEYGKVTLPDYPNAQGTLSGTLTITKSGNTIASFDGSEDVIVDLPEGGEADLTEINTEILNLKTLINQLTTKISTLETSVSEFDGSKYLRKDISEEQEVNGYVVFKQGAGKELSEGSEDET